MLLVSFPHFAIITSPFWGRGGSGGFPSAAHVAPHPQHQHGPVRTRTRTSAEPLGRNTYSFLPGSYGHGGWWPARPHQGQFCLERRPVWGEVGLTEGRPRKCQMTSWKSLDPVRPQSHTHSHGHCQWVPFLC